MLGMKGIVLDGYALNPGDLSYEALSSLMSFEISDLTDAKDIVRKCQGMDVAITNKVPFSRETLESLPDLKYIGVTATGYNIIDIEAARDLGIAVTNIPAYSTDAVAQHVFALILNISNSVAFHDEAVKKGEWEKSKCFCFWERPLFELKGRRLGIVGLGNIGKRVAEIALAFGMEVAAYSPHSRMDGVASLSLEELLSSSDIITLHIPLTDETSEIINSESLKKIKRGAILINASRGGLVNESDVIKALDDGTLSAYLADVLSKEPPKDNMLSVHPKAVITPHIAWAPIETRERLMSIVVENLKSFISGGTLNRIV